MASKPEGRQLAELASRFRARLARTLVTLGVLRLIVAGAILFAGFSAADWLFHMPWGWRALPLLATLGALAALLWFSALRQLREHWSDEQLLAWLDRLNAEPSLLLDRLELQSGANIAEAKDATGRLLLKEAPEALPDAPDAAKLLGRAFQSRARGRWMAAAIVALVCLIGAAAALPDYTRIAAVRFFNPFSSTRWPHRTEIAVNAPPDGWCVPQGEPLEVKAAVKGIEIPRELDLFYRVTNKGAWVRERVPVNAAQSAAYRFPEVREPLEFYFSGGDDTTDNYAVRIERRPSLERIVVRLESPSYSGVPVKTKDGGDIEGLEGSRAHVEFTSSIPLKQALLAFDNEKEEELKATGERTYTADFLLTRSTGYAVKLVSQSGHREARPERYEVRVTPDMPPEVQLLKPEEDLEGTRGASYKVKFTASDDFELRKIEVLYRVEGGEPVALSDRITGPIATACRKSSAEFTWDLQQVNLPARDAVEVDLFVRASDANPTGRGVTESTHRHLRIVKPSLFREGLLVEAKALINEAQLAEKNQRLAYGAAKEYQAKGTGAENDEEWRKIVDQQSASCEAVRVLITRLAGLLDRARANRIEREFMTDRLTQIASLVNSVAEGPHAKIEKTLDDVRPRNEAQAAPAALKARRVQALSAILDTEGGQKRAVLELQRVLQLVFDWNDLQSAAVMCLRVYEGEEDCARQSAAIAPKFIGKDMHDLSDQDVDQMLAIGKAQRSAYDAEAALETHLKQILTRAEHQHRQAIRAPIYVAYKEVRDRRVSDRLLKAAGLIENNQPADALEDQRVSVEALRVVKAGLEAAGQPETLAALSLSTPVIDFDEDEAKKPITDPTAPTPPPVLKIVDKAGSDPLTTALLAAGDGIKDLVRRSAYLEANIDPADLPRFKRLRFGRLEALRLGCISRLEEAQAEAGKVKEDFTAGMSKDTAADLADYATSLKAQDLSEGARQVPADAAVTLSDLINYLASNRAIHEMCNAHVQQKGVDAFNQPYVLPIPEQQAADSLLMAMLQSQTQLQMAARVLNRVSKFKAAGPRAELERLRARQAPFAAQLKAVQEQLDAWPEKNRAVVREKMALPSGHDVAAAFAAAPGQESEAARQALVDADALSHAIENLRDLLGQPIPRKPVQQALDMPTNDKTAQMTEAEYEKLTSPAALRDRIRKASSLPAELREVLAKSLETDCPPERQRFVAAYVESILAAAQESKP